MTPSDEIYNLKKECHALMEAMFTTKDEKRRFYCRLARRLKMRPQDCHLSLLDKPHLEKVLDLLKGDKI